MTHTDELVASVSLQRIWQKLAADGRRADEQWPKLDIPRGKL